MKLDNIQGQVMKDLSYQANELEFDPKGRVGATEPTMNGRYILCTSISTESV